MSHLLLDTVFIKQLHVETIVGILPQERITPQPILLDITLSVDTRTPAKTGDIADACDYSTMAVQVSAFIIEQQFQLLETLAEDVAALILRDFQVEEVLLRVSKPKAVAAADCVGVEILRSK
jgi:dihydroneopterin aldolase